MVDVGVALAWVAISGLSLKWLSVFGQRSEDELCEPGLALHEGELLSEEHYPLDLTPFPVGSSL
jgi:hypothetical protein